MRYVFPSFDAAYRAGKCTTKPSDLNEPGKVLSWQCATRLPDGNTVPLVYGGWESWDAGQRHYASKYGTSGAPAGSLLAFGPSPVGHTAGALQAARYFARSYPYSVTVIAQSVGDANAAMGQVVARSLAEIAG